ncbi:hypothetical protein, partial [Pseudomonas syringae]
YEITRDDEDRTDLYVTKSSLEAVASPKETLDQWQKSAALADMLVVTALLPLGAALGAGTEPARLQVARTEFLQQLNSQRAGGRSSRPGAAGNGLTDHAE